MRRRLLTHVVAMTAVSGAIAFTAIVALWVVNDRVALARNVIQRAETVQHVQAQLQRVASAGERIVLAGEGEHRLATAIAELVVARERMREQGDELSALDRRADDYAVAVTTGVTQRGAIDAYRGTVRPVREAFERDAATLLARLRSEAATARERADVVSNRARLGIALTVLLGIALTLALGARLLRDLRQQARRSKAAADAARKAIVSRQELLAASNELRAPVETILQRSSTLDEITAAGERLQRVLERLLDVTAVEEKAVELARERCDTSSLLDVAATSIQLLAAERAVHIQIDAPIPILVDVDRRRMLQVVSGLLGGAVRSARPGGEITVAARPVDGEVRIAIFETSAEGLPERARPAASDSSAMNLHLSRRMIEAHGGRFGGEHAAPGGIWFHLPTEPQSLQQPTTSRSASAMPLTESRSS